MTNLSQDNQTCHNALNIILSEIMSKISDINSDLFEQSFYIVFSCMSSSNEVTLFMVPKVLPILISHYKTAVFAQKLKLLKCMERVCVILDKQNIITKLNKEDLDLFWNELMHTVVNESNPSILEITFEIIRKVVNIIPKENRLTIYSKFVDLAGDLNYSTVIHCMSSTITSFDTQFPNEVNQFVLDRIKLLSTQHTNAQPMKLLIHLMFVQNFNEDLNQFIFQCILSERKDNMQFEILRFLVDNKKEYLISTKMRYIEEIVCFIQKNPNLSAEVLKYYSLLLEILMKNSDVDVQNKIIIKFLLHLEPEKKADLYVLSGCLGHLGANMHLNAHFEQLSQKLIKVSTLSKEKECQMMCYHLLCSLFNKVPDDDMDKCITKRTLDGLVSEIRCHKDEFIIVFSWISKALLMRAYYDYEIIIDTVSICC